MSKFEAHHRICDPNTCDKQVKCPKTVYQDAENPGLLYGGIKKYPGKGHANIFGIEELDSFSICFSECKWDPPICTSPKSYGSGEATYHSMRNPGGNGRGNMPLGR